MEKRKYEYEGVTYEISKDLMDKWLKREGIDVGNEGSMRKFLQTRNAMECVIANAKGRLQFQGTEPSKEAMEQAIEEIIKEEIELTGGAV